MLRYSYTKIVQYIKNFSFIKKVKDMNPIIYNFFKIITKIKECFINAF